MVGIAAGWLLGPTGQAHREQPARWRSFVTSTRSSGSGFAVSTQTKRNTQSQSFTSPSYDISFPTGVIGISNIFLRRRQRGTRNVLYIIILAQEQGGATPDLNPVCCGGLMFFLIKGNLARLGSPPIKLNLAI